MPCWTNVVLKYSAAQSHFLRGELPAGKFACCVVIHARYAKNWFSTPPRIWVIA